MALPGKIRLGQSSKGFGAYTPLYGAGLLTKHFWEETQKAEAEGHGGGNPYDMDIDWEELRKEITHRHSGHPRKHEVRLGHRPKSSDPLHGEESKLAQQYEDLREKALAGQCTPDEMRSLRTIKGRISEINASRQKDARTIYMGDGDGGEEENGEAVEHEGEPPVADMRSGFHVRGKGIRQQTPVYGDRDEDEQPVMAEKEEKSVDRVVAWS